MEGETVTPRRVQVALPQWKVPDGHRPMLVLGFDYGGWAAFEKPFDGSAFWTLCNVATGLFMQWAVPEVVARAAARMLSEALPDWHVLGASDDDGGAKRQRAAFKAAWEGEGGVGGIRDRALAVRPATVARPFVVQLKRVVNLLVFAEDQIDVEDAVRAQARDRDFFDRFLNNQDVDVEVYPCGAADAACECGVSRSSRGNVSAAFDNYFWAIDNRLYDPEQAPGHLYLVPGPGDHGHQCPAKPRKSALGEVAPGACTCQALVFPAPPEGVHVPRWPGDDGTGDAPRHPDVSCSQCGRAFGPGDHGFSHCDQHAGLVGHD